MFNEHHLYLQQNPYRVELSVLIIDSTKFIFVTWLSAVYYYDSLSIFSVVELKSGDVVLLMMFSIIFIGSDSHLRDFS